MPTWEVDDYVILPELARAREGAAASERKPCLFRARTGYRGSRERAGQIDPGRHDRLDLG